MSNSSQMNSNENIFNELTNNTHGMLLNNSNSGFIQTAINQQQQLQHQLKSTTPVFELLMSPLFNTIMPSSSGSCSNSSTSSSSNSSTNNASNQNHLISNTFNQFNAAAAAAALSAAISLNKTPISSPTQCESLKQNPEGAQSSFKRTKDKKSKIPISIFVNYLTRN
jgi:hypothetical protein